MSVISQSVIFAGTASALSSSLNPAIATHYYDRGSSPFTASVLYMALQKQANWSQYRNWLSPIGAIFNSGSSGTNTNRSGSGLVNLFIPNSVAGVQATGSYRYNANSIEKIYIWECGEAVAIALFSSSSITSSQAVNFMATSNTTSGSIYAGIAGAYIDPESNDTTVDSEIDGRLYGIAATGIPIGGGTRCAIALNSTNIRYEMVWMTTGVSSNHHSDFLSHCCAYSGVRPANHNKALYYVPNTDQKRYMTLINTNSMGLPTYTPRGFLPSNPLYYFDGTGDTSSPGTGKFLGRLREIEAIKGAPSGMTYRSGSVDYGYTLGGSTNFATQAILFRTGI
jgi:hypothetical protein